jgi:hypothetical protein
MIVSLNTVTLQQDAVAMALASGAAVALLTARATAAPASLAVPPAA